MGWEERPARRDERYPRRVDSRPPGRNNERSFKLRHGERHSKLRNDERPSQLRNEERSSKLRNDERPSQLRNEERSSKPKNDERSSQPTNDEPSPKKRNHEKSSKLQKSDNPLRNAFVDTESQKIRDARRDTRYRKDKRTYKGGGGTASDSDSWETYAKAYGIKRKEILKEAE